MAGTDDPRDALTPMTKAGRAFVGTFIEHAGPDYRAAASHDIAVIEAEARALSPAQAAEQDRLAAIGAAVETAAGFMRFTKADLDAALRNLRGPLDRDESYVMAAAMGVAAALDEPVTGEPER